MNTRPTRQNNDHVLIIMKNVASPKANDQDGLSLVLQEINKPSISDRHVVVILMRMENDLD
jgi:hypothetical protein